MKLPGVPALREHVYAVDIEPKVIAVLDQRIEEAGVKNITTRVASAYEIPLPDNSVDRALMVGVLPQIPDKHRALGEIRRVLKKQGLLALAEVLIDPNYPFRKTEIGWCRDTGFELVGDYGGFFFYTLTFRPTDEPPPEEELRSRGDSCQGKYLYLGYLCSCYLSVAWREPYQAVTNAL